MPVQKIRETYWRHHVIFISNFSIVLLFRNRHEKLKRLVVNFKSQSLFFGVKVNRNNYGVFLIMNEYTADCCLLKTQLDHLWNIFSNMIFSRIKYKVYTRANACVCVCVCLQPWSCLFVFLCPLSCVCPVSESRFKFLFVDFQIKALRIHPPIISHFNAH